MARRSTDKELPKDNFGEAVWGQEIAAPVDGWLDSPAGVVID